MTTEKIASGAGNNPTPQPMLSNLAKCQPCGSPMTVAVTNGQHPPRYACPSIDCPTPEIDVRQLDEIIINRVVADIFTADMLQDVSANVRNNARRQAEQEQRRLESLHGELERLNVEASDAEDDERLAQERRAVREAAQQAEHALQGFRHVADGDGTYIADYASNPETHLRETNEAATKSILELAVREVLVSPDAVTVAYAAEPRIGQPASNGA